MGAVAEDAVADIIIMRHLHVVKDYSILHLNGIADNAAAAYQG